MRLREAKFHAKGHRASKRQSCEVSLLRLTSNPVFFLQHHAAVGNSLGSVFRAGSYRDLRVKISPSENLITCVGGSSRKQDDPINF